MSIRSSADEQEQGSPGEIERQFSENLRILHEVGNELSRAPTVDELCRLTVKFGMERLGFSRLSVWFSAQDPLRVLGTYGTAESGEIRDEREDVVVGDDNPPEVIQVLKQKMRLVRRPNTPLGNNKGEIVKKVGVHAVAGLWDGQEIIGVMNADDFLAPGSLNEKQAELLALYATTVGHLCSQKRTEEALRKSEAQLRESQRIAHIGGWERDVLRNKVWWSEEFYLVLGLDRETTEPSFPKYLSCLHPEDQIKVKRIYEALEREGDSFNYECRIVRPDESVRYAYVNGHVERDAAGRPIRYKGTTQDITQRVLAEQERRRLELQFQQAQKMESLGIMAGGIAHDFNNLLVGILGNADLAIMDLPEDSAAKPSLEQVVVSAKLAAGLSGQMLAYSGRGQFVVQALDLSVLVKEITHLLKVAIGVNVRLELDLAEALPAIEADASQIRQIVMNLITNASEAIGKADGVISISTGAMRCDRNYLEQTGTGQDLPEGTYVYFDVSDSGQGMDAQTQGKIFDPFFTTKFTGRGLGLAAVIGIVRGHKGTIQVNSKPEGGSTFRVLLPASEKAAEPAEPQSGGAEGLSGEGTILLIDDDAMVRHVGMRILTHAGFDIRAAAGGLEGIELFEQEPDEFDCVIVDWTMPDLDGQETAARLRAIREDVPILMCSGYAETDVIHRFNGRPLAGFVQKPFGMETLIEKVKQVVNRADKPGGRE